jgi:hypothetical protein
MFKTGFVRHWRMLLNLDQIFGAQKTNFPPWVYDEKLSLVSELDPAFPGF